MSRTNYYQDANFVSDRTSPTHPEDDELLPGDFGGRGTGLAGGHAPSRPPYPHPPYSTHAHTRTLEQDDYAGFDPGMAGCDSDACPCSIPGIPCMGCVRIDHTHSASPPPPPHPDRGAKVGISRGYERDGDEYESEVPSPVPTPPPPVALAAPTDATGPDPQAGTSAGQDPAQSQRGAQDSKASGNPSPEPDRPSTNGKPPIGSRIVGRVERLAGKVFHDPEIEARGIRHMTGHL